VPTGQFKQSLPIAPSNTVQHSAVTYASGFTVLSSDGKTLAYQGTETLDVIDVPSGRTMYSFPGPPAFGMNAGGTRLGWVKPSLGVQTAAAT
jgi:hypothetical protein